MYDILKIYFFLFLNVFVLEPPYKYPEVVELGNNLTSLNVINKMKEIFARHGIPQTVISDGGPQFTSEEFEKCYTDYEFDHETSSPTYAQSNGMAERNIQTAKAMFKKVLEEKKDINLALLYYRNTPILGSVSPAEALMSRKLRSKLPYTEKSLKPKVVTNEMTKTIEKLQKTEQKYYNAKSAKELPKIANNTKVYVQRSPKSIWTPGVVICQERDRSYRVKLEGGSILVRNRRFIKPVRISTEPKQLTQKHIPTEKKEKTVEYKIYIEVEKDENDEIDQEGLERLSSSSSETFAESLSSSSSETFEDAEASTENTDSDREEALVTRTTSGRVVKPPLRLDL